MSDILNPRKYYFDSLEEKVKNAALEYFEKLVDRSGINREQNIETIKKLRAKQEELSTIKQALDKLRMKRIWLIILTIISFIAMLVCIPYALKGENVLIFVLVIIGTLLLGVGCILYITLVLNKRIKVLSGPIANLEDAINNLIAAARRETKALNDVYDYNMAIEVFNNTIDSFITMDQFFDVNKYQYLVKKFGFVPNKSVDQSTCLVKSGNILGNPFLLYKTFNTRIINKDYTGSITIHWTTTYHDKNGTHTEHHTQTLTATITKPAPYYSYITHMVYGNEAAPNLSFSRKPSGMSGKSEKKLDKTVKKNTKKLDKKARIELTDDDPTTNYTRFSNDEFEVLFGGTNRDNEIEYRLLFTPLAIQNELDIIKNKEPYGDDFYFEKMKKINLITSKHSQIFDYSSDPSLFISYSYEESRDKFVKYCTEFFRAVYFDLAPLISIPLYQQTKTQEYIYDEPFESNYTVYEEEALANDFNPRLFAHENTTTDTILKASIDSKDGPSDRVRVDAYSYQGVDRVEYVNKMGGDGRMHSIPVNWVEYFPLEKQTLMYMSRVNGSRREYNELLSANGAFKSLLNYFSNYHIYRRGFLASIVENEAVEKSFNNLSNYFKGLYNNSSVNNNTNNNSNSNIKNSQDLINVIDKMEEN